MRNIPITCLKYALICLLLCLLVLAPALAQDETSLSLPTAEHDPAFAVEWMQTIYHLVKDERVNVPSAARIYAYTGVTLYQSVAFGIPEPISFTDHFQEMPPMPLLDSTAVYDWPSVANGALSVVTEALFFPEDEAALENTGASLATRQTIEGVVQKQILARLRQANREIVERSFAYGQQMGQVIADWATTDRYAQTRAMVYELPDPDNPANWNLTTAGQTAMEPYWGMIRPFVLLNADQCAVPLDVPFDTDLDSTFYAQAMEVRDMLSTLTEDQQQIASFWDERPGESGTAAGHWVDVENQLVDYLDLNLEEAATMYGLMGVVFQDSFISTWSLKYQVNLLRPESYINTYVDPDWEPYRQTPPFPAYPSGHSVLDGAVAEVLTALFDPLAYTDRYGVQYGLRARSYTSFEAAAYENAISRMYGGVHYRFDLENGLSQGRCVGQTIVETLLEN